uniref:condensation domain-containing protein n=1 Tax=Salinispora arenicola TaxID=168697 RepID=UPI0012BC25D4
MMDTNAGSVREWLAARRPAAIPRRREADEPRASPAQQRMWFEDQYRRETDPSLPGYTSPHAIRMGGPVDVAALMAALSDVVARHETLRTTFVMRDGTLHQRIHPPGPANFRVETVPGDSPTVREQALQTLLATAIAEPFDLKEGPIIRARLFRLTDTDHVLLVVVHHIATDGW